MTAPVATPAVLGAVRVVLVEPTHPGNIGAAARAMKTMGLEQLVLVSPARYPSAEATARASGADDVLARARVVASVEEALAGCVLVAGTTARRRHLPWPEVDAAEGARQLLAAAGSAPVALLFGREHSGLTNHEVERCNLLVRIPANPAYSSLNLAAAVQILAYEISRQARGPEVPTAAGGERVGATRDEVDRLLEHLQAVAAEVGFLDPAAPRLLMRRLGRLCGRARLERTEVQVLRGLLTAIQKRLGE